MTIEENIEILVPYIIATLEMAFSDALQRSINRNDPESEWGYVHKGRVSSSINQLEGLLKKAKANRKRGDHQKREEQCLYEELKYVYPELAIPDERTREERKRNAEQDKIDLFGPEKD